MAVTVWKPFAERTAVKSRAALQTLLCGALSDRFSGPVMAG